jgi:multiple sugar transport system substrate-binding protein
MTRTKAPTRRQALGLIAGAGAAAAATSAGGQTPAAPAVRKKVTLSYWTWADNPGHQKRVLEAVDLFNNSQNFVTVEVDATSVTMEARKKVVVAYAAGAAPDLAGTVQTHAQDWYDTGILYPVDEFFTNWDKSADYIPKVVDAMRGKPGQPVLYMPIAILPYLLYYRADWFDEAKLAPPVTYDDFIAAAKALAKPPERYGYVLRGVDYYAVQPIEPIWASAGVQFVDKDGNVDFDGPAAIAVTEKWVGMFTKDKSAQPTAVNDRYPELFALMERGKGAQWIYGAHANPQLNAALGERIQAVPTPRVGDKPYMLANPEGNFITTSCKEKEAAWEFLVHLSDGAPARSLGPERGLMPVRKSLSADPLVQNNRFFKVASSQSDNWWMPPFAHEYWANYQDKIAPYWQQTLREEISVADFHKQAAKFLRGEA